MKKPLIVISPQNMPMEAPFKENYNYSNCFNSKAVVNAGGIPMVPPFLGEADALQLMEQADGLYLTGGADIDPALYGEEKLPQCGKLEPERDVSDRNLLKAALELHKPVLCICRGCQMVNVYLGGTLYQDLPTQRPSRVNHRLRDYPAHTQGTAHQVSILENTPLRKLMGEESLGVNSLHHQGIKTLAPELLPMAVAPDGLVESYYCSSRWIRGYQWHPEMIGTDPHSRIFTEFMDACRK